MPTSFVSAAALRVRSVSMLSDDCDGACFGTHFWQNTSWSPKSETLYVLRLSLSLHSGHLKHALWYVNVSPATFTATDSAGYADLVHRGHFGAAAGCLKGMMWSVGVG